MSARARLGILLSGRGSNFEAIADAVAAGSVPAEIALVVSNRTQAAGLEKARQRQLPVLALPPLGRDRESYDAALAQALRDARIDWICLAGYMRLLTPAFVNAFPGRILNIHPSLLPAFPGLDAQRQALEHGVKVSGCTVHFVDATLDGGPILAQTAVPVEPADTEATLAARILAAEHRLYPEALRLVLTGRWRIEGRRVIVA